MKLLKVISVFCCIYLFVGCTQWNAGWELGARNQYFIGRILLKGTHDYLDYLDLQKRAFPALEGYCRDNGNPSVILPLYAHNAEFVWEDSNTTVTISAVGQLQIVKRIPEKVTNFRRQSSETPRKVTSPAPKSSPKLSPKVEKLKISSGTGFAIGKHTVITARHVVKNKKNIKVCFDKKTWLPATLEKQSGALDVAILQVESPLKNYLPLSVENTDEAGDKVFTFGYPVVQLLGSEIKYSEGAISAMSGFNDDQTLIQTTVPIQPGNSGSPLFNEDGKIIGMLTSTAALPIFLKVTGTVPQNINWAVKAEYISILTGHNHCKEKFNFKNRRELIKATRQATCQVLAE